MEDFLINLGNIVRDYENVHIIFRDSEGASEATNEYIIPFLTQIDEDIDHLMLTYSIAGDDIYGEKDVICIYDCHDVEAVADSILTADICENTKISFLQTEEKPAWMDTLITNDFF